jgi:hypothetical protein
MWVLTRRRPTGPRRGTTVLVLGAVSVLIGVGALAVHFWVHVSGAVPPIVLLARLAALAAPLVWAGLTVAGYRAERREGVRTYGARAGLAILAVTTLGVVAAMLPGVLDSLAAVL